MIITKILLTSNPFFDAYIHSDFLGKLIFIGLVILSIATWIILLHKLYLTYQARQNSKKFLHAFQTQKATR